MRSSINITSPGKAGRLRYVWLAAAILCGFACNQKSLDDDYLIRVGSSSISVADYMRAVEASSEESFQGEQTISPSSMHDLRVRVFNQLIDELIISEYAKKWDINVSDEELNTAIEAVKADYPDDTFEKTLLENAVCYEYWKKKMATRLLIDKVIEKELVDKVEITSEDVGVYFQKHFPDGIPEGEDADQLNKRIVQHLRQQKAEKRYHGWIESLRKTMPVEVHQQRWNRLTEANP